ncbi:MAG: S-layer family protein, partial [Magnetococcales bacterium]|nr:S-layer family protein [Magnetococcales bacterium]
MSLAAAMAVWGAFNAGSVSAAGVTVTGSGENAGLPKFSDLNQSASSGNGGVIDYRTYNSTTTPGTAADGTLNLGTNSKAILQWESGGARTGFNIGQGSTLDITKDASISGFTLVNVVNGGGGTTINGTISTVGNSTVIVIDPNGVNIGANANVNDITNLGLYTQTPGNLSTLVSDPTGLNSTASSNFGLQFSGFTSSTNVAINSDISLHSGGNLVIRSGGTVDFNKTNGAVDAADILITAKGAVATSNNTALNPTGALSITTDNVNANVRTGIAKLGDVNVGTGTFTITPTGLLTQESGTSITAASTTVQTSSPVGTSKSTGLNIAGTSTVSVQTSGGASTNQAVYINAVDGAAVTLNPVKATTLGLGTSGATGSGEITGTVQVSNLVLDGAGKATLTNSGSALTISSGATTKSGGATIDITNDGQITVGGTFDGTTARNSTLTLQTASANQAVVVDTNQANGIQVKDLNIVADTVTITNPATAPIKLDANGTASIRAKTLSRDINLGTKPGTGLDLTTAEIAAITGGSGSKLVIGADGLGTAATRSTGDITITADSTAKVDLSLYGASLDFNSGALTMHDGSAGRAFAATITGNVTATADASVVATTADITASTIDISATGNVGVAGLADLDITASGVVNIAAGNSANAATDAINLRSIGNLSLGSIAVRDSSSSLDAADTINLIVTGDLIQTGSGTNLTGRVINLYGTTGANATATAIGTAASPVTVSKATTLTIQNYNAGTPADSTGANAFEGVHLSTDQSLTLANDLYTVGTSGTGISLFLTGSGTTLANNSKAITAQGASDPVTLSAPEIELTGATKVASGASGTISLVDTAGTLTVGGAGGSADALNATELAAISTTPHLSITAAGNITLGGNVAGWAAKNVSLITSADILGSANTISGATLTLSADDIGSSGSAVNVTSGTALVITGPNSITGSGYPSDKAATSAYVNSGSAIHLGNTGVSGALSVTTTTGAVDNISGATLKVGGQASVTSAGTISLGTNGVNGASDTVNFGSVNLSTAATGNAITVTEDSAMQIDGLITTGAATLNAAGDVTNVSGVTIDVTGLATISSTGAITLGTNGANGASDTVNFGSVDLRSSGGSAIALTEDSAMQIDYLSTTGAANLRSSGAVTNGANATFTAGATTIYGTAITLDTGGTEHNEFTSLTLTSTTGDITVIQTHGDMLVKGIDSAGAVTLETTETTAGKGAITQGSTASDKILAVGSVTVDTSVSNTGAGSVITLDNTNNAVGSWDLTSGSGNVTVKETGAMQLDGLSTATAATVDLTATGAVTAGATAIISAGAATISGTSISLDVTPITATEKINFASVDLTATNGNVTLVQTEGDMTIKGIAANSGTGNVTLTTTDAAAGKGVISQDTSSGADISALGTVTLNTSASNGKNITLTNSDNVAGSWNITAGTGTVSVTEKSGMSIAQIVSAGGVTLTSNNGDLSQTGTINATGTVTANTSTGGGDVTLTQDNTVGAWSVTSNGGDVALTETGGMSIAQISTAVTGGTSGTLQLTSKAGALTQTSTITAGVTTITMPNGHDVTLTDTNNDVTSWSVSNGSGGAAGIVQLTEKNGMAIASLVSGNATLDVQSGHLTQTGVISAGNLTLNSATGGGNIDLQLSNVLTGSWSVTGSNGGSVQLKEADATMTVGAITTTGTGTGGLVNLTSTGAVTQTGAITSGGGAVTVSAGGDVTQTGAISSGGGAVTVSAGGDVTQTGAITTTGGAVQISSGGADGDISLASIDTTGGAGGAKGTLQITAVGTGDVTDVADPVLLAGATTITTASTGVITLDATTGVGTPQSNFSSLDLTSASGAITVVQKTGDMVLANLATTGTAVTLTTAASGATVTDGGTLSVPNGKLTIATNNGAITLDASHGATPTAHANNFGSLDLTSGTGLMAVTQTSGNMVIAALSNSAAPASGAAVTLTNNAVAGSVTNTTGAMSVTNNLKAVTNGGTITLNDTGGATTSFGSLTLDTTTGSATTPITVKQTGGNMVVAGISNGTAGTVSLTTTDATATKGTITQGSATTDKIVAGAVTVNSSAANTKTVTLDNSGNAVASWSVNAGTGAVTLRETDAMDLNGVTGGVVSVTSGGNITDSNTVTASTSFAFVSAGAVDLGSLATPVLGDSYATGGNVALTNTGAALTVGNIFVVDSTGSQYTVGITNSGNNITLDGIIAATTSTTAINNDSSASPLAYDGNLTASYFGSGQLKYLKEINLSTGTGAGSILVTSSADAGFLKAESFNFTSEANLGSGIGNDAVKIDWESTVTSNADRLNINMGDFNGLAGPTAPTLYVEQVKNSANTPLGHVPVHTDYTGKFLNVTISGNSATSSGITAAGDGTSDSFTTNAGRGLVGATDGDVADFFLSLATRVSNLEDMLGIGYFSSTNTVAAYVAQIINGAASGVANSVTGVTFNMSSTDIADDSIWSATEFLAGKGPKNETYGGHLYAMNAIADEAFNRVNLVADFRAAADSSVIGGVTNSGNSLADEDRSVVVNRLSKDRVVTTGTPDTVAKLMASTITDGTATLTSGHLTGAGTISGGTFTDGTATMTAGNLTTTGTVRGGTLTDGTARMSGGTLTDGTATMIAGNVTTTGTVRGGTCVDG